MPFNLNTWKIPYCCFIFFLFLFFLLLENSILHSYICSSKVQNRPFWVKNILSSKYHVHIQHLCDIFVLQQLVIILVVRFWVSIWWWLFSDEDWSEPQQAWTKVDLEPNVRGPWWLELFPCCMPSVLASASTALISGEHSVMGGDCKYDQSRSI